MAVVNHSRSSKSNIIMFYQTTSSRGVAKLSSSAGLLKTLSVYLIGGKTAVYEPNTRSFSLLSLARGNRGSFSRPFLRNDRSPASDSDEATTRPPPHPSLCLKITDTTVGCKTKLGDTPARDSDCGPLTLTPSFQMFALIY